ncbi:MAG: hypothetical protein KatS3mg129_0470 [Leptospiraceae bacterium]|nr:MAG: hypothetical protein KatS3mg129_0470 [Leptospiraceae bacterium]
MKDTKKIIIYSILILLILIAIIGLFRYYATIHSFIIKNTLKWHKYNSNNIEFFYLLPDKPKKIVFIIPDQRMDKYWNTYNIETNMGLNLSYFLYQNNIIPIIYDREDAFKEAHIFYSKEKLKKQLLNLFNEFYDWKSKYYNHLEVILFAHGDGCTLAMMTLLEYPLTDKLILSQCGYDNSLLDYYINVIFYTMEISSIEPEIIHLAKQEIENWKKQNDFSIITEKEWQEIQKRYIEQKIHPDLIAFRKTIARFQSPQNISFLKEAKNIYFLKLIQSLIHKRIRIYHFISEKDEEMPENILNALKKQYQTFNTKYYHLIILKNTDHFLFYNDTKLSSPMEILLHRNNPFKEFSSEFKEKLLKILL